MDHDEVIQAVSDAELDGRRPPRAARAHLRDCAECRDFQAAMSRRHDELKAIAPPLGLAAAAALVKGFFGGGGAGGLGAGAAGGGAAGKAGLVGGGNLAGASLASKTAAVVAATAIVGGAAGGAAKLFVDRGGDETKSTDVARPATAPSEATSEGSANGAAGREARRRRHSSSARASSTGSSSPPATVSSQGVVPVTAFDASARTTPTSESSRTGDGGPSRSIYAPRLGDGRHAVGTPRAPGDRREKDKRCDRGEGKRGGDRGRSKDRSAGRGRRPEDRGGEYCSGDEKGGRGPKDKKKDKKGGGEEGKGKDDKGEGGKDDKGRDEGSNDKGGKGQKDDKGKGEDHGGGRKTGRADAKGSGAEPATIKRRIAGHPERARRGAPAPSSSVDEPSGPEPSRDQGNDATVVGHSPEEPTAPEAGTREAEASQRSQWGWTTRSPGGGADSPTQALGDPLPLHVEREAPVPPPDLVVAPPVPVLTPPAPPPLPPPAPPAPAALPPVPPATPPESAGAS